MRSPEIISSGQILALDSGTSGKLQLGPELGGTRPSHQPSMKHLAADSPMGNAHCKELSWGLSRKGRPCGESRRNHHLEAMLLNYWPFLPETAHPLLNSQYGLEGTALCAKGAWVHPPTLHQGRDTLLQKAFLPKGTRNNSDIKKRHAQNGFFQRRRIKAPESWDRDADRWTMFC